MSSLLTGEAPQSLASALHRGARAVARQPIAAAASFGGLGLLVAAGCLVPWANIAFILFALAPLLGGAPALALALIHRQPVGAELLFRGFRTYERFLGLFWLGYLLLGFLAFPWLLVLALGRHLPPLLQSAAWGLGAAAAVAGLGLAAARWLFVFLIAAEAPPEVSLDAVLQAAADLSHGRRWRCLGHGLACGALALSGLALLGIGALVTVPWAAGTLAALYEDAKTRVSIPGATTSEPPAASAESPWYSAPASVHELDYERKLR
ncbi:MAG: hypothetical protein SX243_15365 [Acidobacteriota bacterium]|nr:hypothetical protein [Acidobacteriota bacterium]